MSLNSTWTIAKAVINILGPMVEQCILNQTKGYWLLLDALFATFSICSKMHKEYRACASLNLPLMRRKI